ncbi:MAG: helix-turn-helix domain-containing protein, partial [bacterium]
TILILEEIAYQFGMVKKFPLTEKIYRSTMRLIMINKKLNEVNMEKKYLTTKQVAEFLTLSIGTVKGLIKEDKIPYYRIGKRIVFDQEEIIKWVESQREEPKAATR